MYCYINERIKNRRCTFETTLHTPGRPVVYNNRTVKMDPYALHLSPDATINLKFKMVYFDVLVSRVRTRKIMVKAFNLEK